MKVIVYHDYYGCETGCCGHVVKIDDKVLWDTFDFAHPCGDPKEWALNFAREALEERFGPHAFDLDWENCDIIDD